MFVVSEVREFNLVRGLLAHRWQTIPERGVVTSREPAISLEWLIVSGAVNLVRR